MKKKLSRLSLLAAAAVLSTGCVPMRHNLPPEQRMLEPGPGVGGPGPGVLGAPAMRPGMGAMGMPGPAGMGAPCGPGMPMGPAAAMRMPTGGPGTPIGPANSPMMSAPLLAPPMGTQASMPSDGSVKPASFTGMAGGCPPGTAGCLPNLNALATSNIPTGGGVLPVGGPMGGGMIGGQIGVPAAVQVTMGSPDGMQVRFDSTGAGMFDSQPLVVPVRQDFPQGGLYRLKLTNIPTRPGVELYPTLELAYANPRTGAYLAHNTVPVQFTEEDFDQVLTGNFVTKVIYLPDPDFQGPALAGIDTLVSTRLDPGIDPIVEADRRGSILAIIRLGDKDVEASAQATGFMAGGMMAPPIAGLPAPFALASTPGCGGPSAAGDCGSGGCGSGGCGCSGPSTGGPGCVTTPPSLPGMVAGMTAPQYGMPITGTPIGLPGPPHIPLGVPAGLKKHVIRNHTPMHIPRPVEKVKMNVRMQPGYSYPNPVSRVKVTEQNIHPGVPHGRGLYQHASQRVDPNCQP